MSSDFSPEEVKRAFQIPSRHEQEPVQGNAGGQDRPDDLHPGCPTSSVIHGFDPFTMAGNNGAAPPAFPCRSKSRVKIVGVLQGDSTTKELVFSKSDIKMFSSFASQASIIIENARLHEQAQKKIDQLMFLHSVSEKTSSTLNLNKLVDIITCNRLEPFPRPVLCASADGSRQEIYAGCILERRKLAEGGRMRVKVGENISGWVAEKGVPLLVNDVTQEPRYSEIHPDIASMLSVPLLAVNKCPRGHLRTSEKKAAFSLDELELLMTLAGHAAALINNVRLTIR